jgi:hypothetical protein
MRKELFDDAIGEVPPSSVDVDAVITRGRRAARIRRVANPAVAAGVAVVLLTGAVAYTMTRDDGSAGGPPVGGQPSSGTTTLATSGEAAQPPGSGGPPEGCQRPDLETPAQMIARLNPVLAAAFQAQRPDVTVTGGGPYEALKFSLANGEVLCNTGAYLMALARTHGPEGTGNFEIVVSAPPGDPTSGSCDGISGPDTVCTVVISPHGDVIRQTTGQLKYGATEIHIEIDRPDGTAVMVTADNVGSTDGTPPASTPPLTVDQLVAIGTDAGMTLFP